MAQFKSNLDHTESVTLKNVIITPDPVEKKLNKLNVSKSAGQDMLHPWVLKLLASTTKVPLQIIFSKSIMEVHYQKYGRMPTYITPIHKKG